MSPKARRAFLAVSLIASLAAARWVASQEAPAQPQLRERDESPQRARATSPSPARAQAAAPAVQTEELAVEKLTRPAGGAHFANLFPDSTWEPPPAKRASREPAPPAPTAPPLPFSYFGKLSEDGHTTVFLNGANRNYAARVGDVLDGQYKVDDIRDAAIVLTYLPLQLQQTLSFGN